MEVNNERVDCTLRFIDVHNVRSKNGYLHGMNCGASHHFLQKILQRLVENLLLKILFGERGSIQCHSLRI